MLGQPAVVAGHHRGDAEREALLAEQGVAAVARAVRPDLARVGEVDDVLVVGVAGPGHVDLARLERCADRMQAGHPLAVAEHVECRLTHAGHDPHRHRHVGRVGELHADVGDPRSERTHRERDDVQRATPHRTVVEGEHLGAHLGRVAPVVVGAGLLGGGRADERAVFHAGDVAGVGVGPVAVGALGLVELGERAGGDELTGQPVVLLGAPVAPVHGVGPQHRCPVVDPALQSVVRGGCAHVGPLARSVGAATLPSSDHQFAALVPRASWLKRSNDAEFVQM